MKFTDATIKLLLEFKAECEAILASYTKELPDRAITTYPIKEVVYSYNYYLTHPTFYKEKFPEKELSLNLPPHLVIQTPRKITEKNIELLKQADKNSNLNATQIKTLFLKITKPKTNFAFDTFTIRQIQAAIKVLDLLLKHKANLGDFYSLTSTSQPNVDTFSECMQAIDGNQFTWVPPVTNAASASFTKAYLKFINNFIPLVKNKEYIDSNFVENLLISGIEKLVGYKQKDLLPMFLQLEANIQAELTAYQYTVNSQMTAKVDLSQLNSIPFYSLNLNTNAHDEFEETGYNPPSSTTIKLFEGQGKQRFKQLFTHEIESAIAGKLDRTICKDIFLKTYSATTYDALITELNKTKNQFIQFVSTYNNKAWKKTILEMIATNLSNQLHTVLTAKEYEQLFGKNYVEAYAAIEYIKGCGTVADIEKTAAKNTKGVATEDKSKNTKAMQETLEKFTNYINSVEKLLQGKQKNGAIVNKQLDIINTLKIQISAINENQHLTQPTFNKLCLSLKTLSLSQILVDFYKELQDQINLFIEKISAEQDTVGTTGEELNKLKTTITQLILKITVGTEPLIQFDIAEHEKTLARLHVKNTLIIIKNFVDEHANEAGCKEINDLLNISDFKKKLDTRCENLFYWIRHLAQKSQKQQSSPEFQAQKTKNLTVVKFYALLATAKFEYNALLELCHSVEALTPKQQPQQSNLNTM